MFSWPGHGWSGIRKPSVAGASFAVGAGTGRAQLGFLNVARDAVALPGGPDTSTPRRVADDPRPAVRPECDSHQAGGQRGDARRAPLTGRLGADRVLLRVRRHGLLPTRLADRPPVRPGARRQRMGRPRGRAPSEACKSRPASPVNPSDRCRLRPVSSGFWKAENASASVSQGASVTARLLAGVGGLTRMRSYRGGEGARLRGCPAGS
jgi:hypothetical protein